VREATARRASGALRAVVRMVASTAAAAAALGGIGAGCADRAPEERGAALFADPGLSPDSMNGASCATCHVAGAVAPDTWYSGGSLAGVAGRPSYFNGEIGELRGAVNFCLRFFMRHPELEPLTEDDPEGLDLLAYLDTLGTEPAPEVHFTIKALLVDDLPPGDATRGAAVWAGGCTRCHGAPHTGEGRASVLVAVIPDETLMFHGPDEARDATIEKVRHGPFYGSGGNMAPFSLESLPNQPLADVLSYLGY